MAFSPSGSLLATSSALNGGTVLLWSLSDPERPRRVGPPLLGGSESKGDHAGEEDVMDEGQVRFSPDGRTLARAAYRALIVFDVSNPNRPRRLRETFIAFPADISSVVFAPAGNTLAVAAGSEITLWDLGDPLLPRRLGQPMRGFGRDVNSISFAGDGHTLAVSADEQVTLWDLSDPERARRLGQPLDASVDFVTAVSFSPDARTLATGFQRGYPLQSGSLLWDLGELQNLRIHVTEVACAILGRGLSPEEWAQYIPGLPYRETCPQ
jgi:WD40 repeat protein